MLQTYCRQDLIMDTWLQSEALWMALRATPICRRKWRSSCSQWLPRRWRRDTGIPLGLHGEYSADEHGTQNPLKSRQFEGTSVWAMLFGPPVNLQAGQSTLFQLWKCGFRSLPRKKSGNRKFDIVSILLTKSCFYVSRWLQPR